LYNSDIFNGEIKPRKALGDSKYNTLKVEEKWTKEESSPKKFGRLFSPQQKYRDPSFDIGSNDDILSERAAVSKPIGSYKP
jgi:hypothetical protein